VRSIVLRVPLVHELAKEHLELVSPSLVKGEQQAQLKNPLFERCHSTISSFFTETELVSQITLLGRLTGLYRLRHFILGTLTASLVCFEALYSPEHYFDCSWKFGLDRPS
jgi:hypothetical protein